MRKEVKLSHSYESKINGRAVEGCVYYNAIIRDNYSDDQEYFVESYKFTDLDAFHYCDTGEYVGDENMDSLIEEISSNPEDLSLEFDERVNSEMFAFYHF